MLYSSALFNFAKSKSMHQTDGGKEERRSERAEGGRWHCQKLL